MTEPLTIAHMDNFEFLHVRGAGADAALKSAVGSLPKEWFRCKKIDKNGFIARLGSREFYVFSLAGESYKTRITGDNLYLFERSDRVFGLRGNTRVNYLRELCAFDFSTCAGDQIVLASMAGVSCWFKMSSDEDVDILVGCDPTYGDYMAEVLGRSLDEFRIQGDIFGAN